MFLPMLVCLLVISLLSSDKMIRFHYARAFRVKNRTENHT